MKKISLDFMVGYMDDRGGKPQKMYPAKVPGNAQLDIASGENYPDYQFGDNYKKFAWMEDVYFLYRSEIEKPPLAANERIYFKSLGIDYEFDISIDGKKIFYQEGMFTPVKLDITDCFGDSDSAALEIVIYPAPKSHSDAPKDRSQADESVKPAVSYGWDWHPRLIVSGLYEECFLEIKNEAHINHAELTYILSDDLSFADITLTSELVGNAKDKKLAWELYDDEGFRVLHLSDVRPEDKITLQNPKLWYPNEYGKQTLYTSVFALYDENNEKTDQAVQKVGFRRVKLIPNEPHPSWNDGFPLTRDLPPITLEVNGIKIFAKGSNWAAPDIFTGTISRETYEPLLKYAKEAHFNLLRMWGGSMISKESFFDLCDEMGIMVWQEFMLACNNYKDIPRYLEVLDRESQSIIKKVRRHACLAIWCGGNELFNNWSGMNDQSHALRLLNANCYHLDRLTPFLPTSPVYGMAHGHYLFRYSDGRDCLEAMINSCKSAYTEFGNPSLADIDSLKAIIPEEQLFPPTPGGAWEEHHAFGAWQKDSWLELPTIEHYFGKPESLEELIGYTQTLQCIGYKGIFEEARRQFPHCSMALNWCYNEPWINAANNNLLIYPAKPKPAYYAVQASCRPIMASARVKRFDYTYGDIFEAELFILNDLPEDLGQFTVTARIDEIIIGKWITGGVRGTSNIRSGIYYSHRLDFAENCMFRLSVEVLDHPEMDSEYLFLYKT